MAMRRPRIKATANLSNIKRKRTLDPDDAQIKSIKKPTENESVGTSNDEANKTTAYIESVGREKSPLSSESTVISNQVNAEEHFEDDTSIKENCTIPERKITNANNTSVSNAELHKDESTDGTDQDCNSFKCPAKVDYNRSISSNNNASNMDEAFQFEGDMDVIQMDLQKSTNGFPMSPTKNQARQRIKHTPIFGQRRNSFVISSPSPHTADDSSSGAPDFTAPTHRRERHYSASISQNSNSHHHYTSHKFTPTMGGGRIRTESGCSAFSEAYGTSGKSRKTDEHNYRNITRREFEARFRKGVPNKSSLKMFDLIYYNPISNPMEQKTKPDSNAINETIKPNVTEPENEVSNAKPKANEHMPVPQLKLNANGELILDDKSLEIETTAEQEARKVLANSSLIYLDENTGMNGFYKRQKRTREWQPEETIKFYRCLQTVGTDFSLMCPLFPKRTRRELKLKFKKEERCNGALINKALLYPKIFNIDELKQQLEADEHEQAEAKRKWKEIKAVEAKIAKKAHLYSSNAARMLTDGDDIYKNEHVVKRKFSKRKSKADSSNANQTTAEISAQEPTQKLEKKQKSPRLKREKSKMKLTKKAFTTVNEAASIKAEFVQDEPQDERAINVEPKLDIPMDLEVESLPITYIIEAIDEKSNVAMTPDNEQIMFNEVIDENSIDNKKFIDLDSEDASSVTVIDTQDVSMETAEQFAPKEQQETQELDETNIEQILISLAEGSLVLVSTLDPDNADKVVNEIYMVNKDTGEPHDDPLDIPEVIVQSILSVMS